MITQDTKQPVMEVKDLIREFPAGDEKIRVLHGIDLTIYEGEMVAIIGQSGSGKSTLMNILGCLDQATAGSYHIYGKAVDKLTADELAELRREHFGFLPPALSRLTIGWHALHVAARASLHTRQGRRHCLGH